MNNITAKMSCFARAYHHLNNDFFIFNDTAAADILGIDFGAIANSLSEGIDFFIPGFTGNREDGLRLIVDRQIAPSVLARSAFCEKTLQNEIKLGCTQYLIFASGYDTYSIRNSDSGLSVFELDLPEMIKDKKERITSSGLTSNSTFVPCDLTQADWLDSLFKFGFIKGKKTFSSMLGLSYYLSKDDFKGLIMTSKQLLCEGSAICFDYPTERGSYEKATNKAMAQAAGEKMISEYSFTEIEKLLSDCGFLIYEHLDNNEMGRQYFSEYCNSVPVHPIKAPEGISYILAIRKD